MPDPQASTRQAPVRDAVGRMLDAVQLLARDHIELAVAAALPLPRWASFGAVALINLARPP
jgi:hypothetical protein